MGMKHAGWDWGGRGDSVDGDEEEKGVMEKRFGGRETDGGG